MIVGMIMVVLSCMKRVNHKIDRNKYMFRTVFFCFRWRASFFVCLDRRWSGVSVLRFCPALPILMFMRPREKKAQRKSTHRRLARKWNTVKKKFILKFPISSISCIDTPYLTTWYHIHTTLHAIITVVYVLVVWRDARHSRFTASHELKPLGGVADEVMSDKKKKKVSFGKLWSATVQPPMR